MTHSGRSPPPQAPCALCVCVCSRCFAEGGRWRWSCRARSAGAPARGGGDVDAQRGQAGRSRLHPAADRSEAGIEGPLGSIARVPRRGPDGEGPPGPRMLGIRWASPARCAHSLATWNVGPLMGGLWGNASRRSVSAPRSGLSWHVARWPSCKRCTRVRLTSLFPPPTATSVASGSWARRRPARVGVELWWRCMRGLLRRRLRRTLLDCLPGAFCRWFGPLPRLADAAFGRLRGHPCLPCQIRCLRAARHPPAFISALSPWYVAALLCDIERIRWAHAEDMQCGDVFGGQRTVAHVWGAGCPRGTARGARASSKPVVVELVFGSCPPFSWAKSCGWDEGTSGRTREVARTLVAKGEDGMDEPPHTVVS